jgi:tight adherence protein B
VSGYRTPALPLPAAAPPFKRDAESIVLSTWLMVVVSFLAASLAALAIVLLVLPRRSTLRNRISAFVSLAQPAAVEQRRQKRDNRTRLATPDAALATPTSRWARLEEALEIARIDISPASLVLWTALGTVGAAWLVPAISGLGAAALLALGVPLGVRALVKMRLGRVRRKFGDQLPDNLEVLASGLRAGNSLVGALSLVVVDAPEPSKSELTRVIGDEQLGIGLDDALLVVVRRMDSRDLDQVALVAKLQRETGANSTEVLDRVVESIRDRQAVRRLVRTLTAQGRLSGGVLVALPLFMLGFMILANRDYVRPLFTETLGRAMLITAILMIGLGWVAIRKVIDIKV